MKLRNLLAFSCSFFFFVEIRVFGNFILKSEILHGCVLTPSELLGPYHETWHD